MFSAMPCDAVRKKHYERAQDLIRLLVGFQRELFEMGLVVTAATMGKVNQEIGWELARHMEKDKLFSPAERNRRAGRMSHDSGKKRR